MELDLGSGHVYLASALHLSPGAGVEPTQEALGSHIPMWGHATPPPAPPPDLNYSLSAVGCLLGKLFIRRCSPRQGHLLLPLISLGLFI